MRTTNRRVDPDCWRNFHQLVLEILGYLESREPSVKVHMGGGPLRAWVRLFISLLMVAFNALLIVVLVVVEGATPWILPMVGLVLLLGWAAATAKPWDDNRYLVSTAEARIQIAELPPINRRSRPRHF